MVCTNSVVGRIVGCGDSVYVNPQQVGFLGLGSHAAAPFGLLAFAA